ncbi:MAG: hypothetical protein AAF702_13665 [Chloroflexota bacterium]
MKNRPHNLIQRWIDALNAESIDIVQTKDIAHDVATEIRNRYQMRQLVHAIRGSVEDPLDCDACQDALPEFIQARLGENVGSNLNVLDVRAHLTLCPSCAGAYADVLEIAQLSRADAIPAANSYPEFDFSFLASSASANAMPDAASTSPQEVRPQQTKDKELDTQLKVNKLVQQALEAGQDWVEDVMSGIILLFGPTLQTQTAGGWALKSSDSGSLLAQVVLAEDEVEGWEIEGSAFADQNDESLCQIEVSLYSVDDPDEELAGIPVVVRYADAQVNSRTDEGGIAEFGSIPVAYLSQLTVHVELPD